MGLSPDARPGLKKRQEHLLSEHLLSALRALQCVHVDAAQIFSVPFGRTTLTEVRCMRITTGLPSTEAT